MKALLQQALDALESAFKQLSVGAYVHGYTETCDNLRKAIAAEELESVGLVSISHFRGVKEMENYDFDYWGELPDGTHLLYTAPTNIDALRQELERVKGERDALGKELCALIKDLL